MRAALVIENPPRNLPLHSANLTFLSVSLYPPHYLLHILPNPPPVPQTLQIPLAEFAFSIPFVPIDTTRSKIIRFE